MKSIASIKRSSGTMVLLAFAAIYLIWGSTYLGILLAIKTIPPFFMAGLRFTIAGILLLCWAVFRGEKMPPLRSVLRIAFSGILMLFLGNGAVTWVEQYLPSGLAAIIVATVPLWFVLLDRRQWKYYFSNRQIIIGLCVGFAGVILLFAGKSAAHLFEDRMRIISLIVLLIGTLSWATGSLYAKYRKIQGSTLVKVAIQMTAAGIAFLMMAFFFESQDPRAGSMSWTSLFALMYLIVFGSMIAYMAYMWLLSVRPASLVGTYAYVNPVVAVILGWMIAGEKIGAQQIIGLAVILCGLFIVNFTKEKKVSLPDKNPNTIQLNTEKERRTAVR